MATDDNTSATFELRLEDGTSGPAEDAASALKSLKEQITADTRALAEMQRAMKNLQGGTSMNVAQFRELKKRIDEKKTAVAQAQSQYLALGGTFGRTAASGKSLTSMFERFTAQARLAPGPIGGVVGQLGALKGLVAGGAITLGLVAIVAALAALVVGTAAAVVSLAGYAIAQGDARRNELLRLEGLTKIRSMYGFAAAKASDLQASIDQVSGSSALGRDQLSKYTEQLHRMGLRGQNLTDALEGMAIKAQTQGEAQASLFASMAAGASMAGQSVRKLSDDVKARLGGIAARQMLSLSVQTAKMREHFGVLFRDIKVEGFLKALQTITQLFSQSTASGRALKALAETLLQPLINGFDYIAPIAKRFFQGVILGFQAVAIEVLKVAVWFKRTFGTDLLKGLDLTSAALFAGKVAAGLFVMSLVAIGVILGILAAPFALLAAQVLYVSHQVKLFYGLVKDAFAFDWAELGTSVTDGIVAGLKSGSAWVIETVKGLGQGAWKAFRSALGIASPSKEFAKLGVEIPRGVQQGIKAGTPGAQGAADSMIRVPDEPTEGKGRGGRSVTIHVGDVHVHSNARDAEGLGKSLKAELERIFEGVAIQLGAPTPGGA